jgi:hypothetical protein
MLAEHAQILFISRPDSAAMIHEAMPNRMNIHKDFIPPIRIQPRCTNP